MISAHLLLLAQATTPAGAAPGGLANSFLVPLVCFGVIAYFMIIRPQNKRQKDLLALVNALKTGDSVVTNSGIHGIISNVKEGSTLMLKIADNVKIEIDKSAIASVDKRPDNTPAATPAS